MPAGRYVSTLGNVTLSSPITALNAPHSRAHRRLLELIDEENEHLAKLNHKWTIVDTQYAAWC